MKTSTIACFIIFLVYSSPGRSATLLTYDRLEAGSGNSFGTNASLIGMLAVGTSNTVSGGSGASAIGLYNNVSTRNALAVGSMNQVSSFGTTTSGLLAVGHANTVHGQSSAVVGAYNSISEDWEFGGGYASLAVGSFNQIDGKYSFVAGTGNYIPRVYDYDGDVHAPHSASLLGYGLICRHDNCTVVGKNNISPQPTVPPSGPSPLFVVGNGADASNRSNAFEVRDNGDIIISKPQGDISMGIYGD